MKTIKPKMIIEMLMLLIMILELTSTHIIPITGHFIVGLVFAVLIGLHVFLNGSWCISIAKAFKTGKVSKKVKRQYIMDLLLLIVWALVIFSGLQLMGLESPREFFAFRIHAVFSRLGSILIIVHMFQHDRQIRLYIRHVKGS